MPAHYACLSVASAETHEKHCRGRRTIAFTKIICRTSSSVINEESMALKKTERRFRRPFDIFEENSCNIQNNVILNLLFHILWFYIELPLLMVFAVYMILSTIHVLCESTQRAVLE